jgi:uncharacterized protein (TIGR00290 family)
MNEKKPIIFAWSGGKDSAYALSKLLQNPDYEVLSLISTFNGNNNRLSMHGVRDELIEAQGASLGIPIMRVKVFGASNEEYEENMAEAIQLAKKRGIDSIAFGDIFLEDLRVYREKQMRQLKMECIFPIWKNNTSDLANAFVDQGFKSIICCVDDSKLDKSWCGKVIDKQFLKDLPEGVDPCGENGEFHSFCFDGPIFKRAIKIKTGEMVFKTYDLNDDDSSENTRNNKKNGFWFIDLVRS